MRSGARPRRPGAGASCCAANHPGKSVPTHPLVYIARTTGLLYLGLAITGAVGFLLIRRRLYDPDDQAATLTNLVENEQLARVGIALEICIALTQALAALWFYRLFRSVDAFAAGAIAVFGVVNAVGDPQQRRRHRDCAGGLARPG
jgi:Domain of unknown function (DUF4386)